METDYSYQKENNDILSAVSDVINESINSEKSNNFEIVFYLDKTDLNIVNGFKERNQDLIVKFYDEIKELENYLNYLLDIRYISLFLITSGSKALKLKEGNSLNNPVIKEVYIYCIDVSNHKEWSQNITKIVQVSSIFNNIEIQIKNNLIEAKRIVLSMSTERQNALYFYDTIESCHKYIYHKCLLNLFEKELFLNENSKKDFIEYCQSNHKLYGGSDGDYDKFTNDISENKFKEERVIWWYTKESFFYRLINKVLRDDKIFDIFKIRFGVLHLFRALKKIQNKSNCPKKLYRVSLISRYELTVMNDLLKNSKKNPIFLQFRGFISTTSNISVIKQFPHPHNENSTSVLYEIEVENENQSVFNIENYSFFKHECECLLNLNTSVKLKSIKQSKYIEFEYIITLSICNNDEITQYIDSKTMNGSHYIKEMENYNYIFDYFYLCRLLLKLRRDDELQNVLNHCVDKDYIDFNIKGEFLEYYGSVYYNKGDLDYAFKFYKLSMEIYEIQFGKDHFQTATSYNNMATVYYEMSDFNSAIKYFSMCLDILKAKVGKDHPQAAVTYNNLGSVYRAKGDLDSALKYYLLSLQIEENKLGKDHIQTAGTYNNIASVYRAKRDLDSAIKYYLSSLEIKEVQLGKDHPETAITYNNIGCIYHDKGDLEMAIKYYFSCLDIRELNLGKDHVDTAVSYNNIGCLYHDKGDLDSAFKFYSMSLKIREEKLGKDHPQTKSTKKNLERL